MLNPITFHVEGESGPLTVTASGLDYAAYEDTFDKAAITGIAEGRYKTWVYLCWHAMHRQELTKMTFDEFLASTPHFGAPEKVEDVPPLESEAPTGQ
jgi:hypothetical protein